MDDELKSTKPKPFIFVLMPFDPSFDDIYKFGIKGAAQDAGAYAERIDEQIFTEGILDRVFNQINKADVVVADMTGRNPNVFYEVGYAHALGKIVLLLTQDAADIPFIALSKQLALCRPRLSKGLFSAFASIKMLAMARKS
jgi:nucleoside 2-deoxyribosyltransferase